MKNQWKLIAGLAFGALLLTFLFPKYNYENELDAKINADIKKTAIVDQNIIATKNEAATIYTLYYKNQQLGIIHDIDKLNMFLDEIYQERYAHDFPDSQVGFGEDLHVTESLSIYEVEDKDDEIIAYIKDNDLFSIMGYKVEFSNGSIAYVKDIDDFTKAREDYVLNFLESNGIDPIETYNKLNLGQEVKNFGNEDRYGSKFRDLSYKFEESAIVSNEFIPISKVLKSYDECITWLWFGYEFTPVYYTVQEFDTIQGIAFNFTENEEPISPLNLVSINSDQLKSVEQILQPGMELNVSPLDSPINVEVVKERIAVEPRYPEVDIEYEYDDTLREGISYVTQDYKEGKSRVLYQEKYRNGELVEGESEMISELVLEYPQPQILKVGTKVEPRVGTGVFRLPTDYASVSCDWGCYWGHTAIDVQNRYNKWGSVLAADRGVIVSNTYDGIGGYQVVINHNNGYYTYYGHMARPSPLPIGSVVAKGEYIGDIGMTGLATGPHVHFEIRTGGYGTAIYPWPLIGW